MRPSTPDQLFRIALTASSERGVHIKLPGEIRLDPQSGQVTAAFMELPQLPFSSIQVRFKGGPRAMLANPIECGSYSTRSVLTPMERHCARGQAQSLFQVGDGGCPRTLPFDPSGPGRHARSGRAGVSRRSCSASSARTAVRSSSASR